MASGRAFGRPLMCLRERHELSGDVEKIFRRSSLRPNVIDIEDDAADVAANQPSISSFPCTEYRSISLLPLLPENIEKEGESLFFVFEEVNHFLAACSDAAPVANHGNITE